MTANTYVPERLGGEPDARDPDPGHGRLPAGPSGQYRRHSAWVENEAADSARELLATVSDRIRNPLQVLLARADLMEDEETAATIREQVRRINDAVKHLEDVLPGSYIARKKNGSARHEKTRRP